MIINLDDEYIKLFKKVLISINNYGLPARDYWQSIILKNR